MLQHQQGCQIFNQLLQLSLSRLFEVVYSANISRWSPCFVKTHLWISANPAIVKRIIVRHTSISFSVHLATHSWFSGCSKRGRPSSAPKLLSPLPLPPRSISWAPLCPAVQKSWKWAARLLLISLLFLRGSSTSSPLGCPLRIKG